MGKILKILISVVVIVIASLAAIIFTTDINHYKPDVIQLVKDKTGRDFSIDGDLELAFSLIPTVAVEGVTLGNAAWAGDTPMIRVSRFEAKIALMPLLKKNIQVNRLILIEPVIHLQTDSQGRGNWNFVTHVNEETPSSTETASTALPSLNVNEVRIEQAVITYKDGQTGKMTDLKVSSITANSAGFAHPLELVVKASLNDSPVSIDATLGSLEDLTNNRAWPVSMVTAIDKANASVKGQIGQPMDARGLDLDFTFDVEALSHLNNVAGATLPDAGPIKVGGHLADTANGYTVSKLIARLQQFELTGELSVSLAGERPAIKANLNADTLDLSPFQKEEKEEKNDRMFSNEPLPLEGLNTVDVDLGLHANTLITKSLTLNNVNLALVLNNGKLMVNPLTAKVAGGDVNINLSLDASDGKTARLDNTISIKQLELGLLPVMQKKNLLSGGKTDVDIRLAGNGGSVSRIAGSMNGKLLIKTGAGRMANDTVDLAGADVIFSALTMLNPMSEKEQFTEMECAVIRFDVKDGIATTDKGIAMQTQRINIVGSGAVDLKTEELALALKPVAREGLGVNIGSLVNAVQITGTLVEPSAGIGAEGALRAGLSAGAAVATGGLSVLAQGLFQKSTADENPCATALGEAPAQSAGSEQPEKKKSAVESTVDTAKEAVQGVTEGAGKLLKGLFD
jgi:hypothetical protein